VSLNAKPRPAKSASRPALIPDRSNTKSDAWIRTRPSRSPRIESTRSIRTWSATAPNGAMWRRTPHRPHAHRTSCDDGRSCRRDRVPASNTGVNAHNLILKGGLLAT